MQIFRFHYNRAQEMAFMIVVLTERKNTFSLVVSVILLSSERMLEVKV